MIASINLEAAIVFAILFGVVAIVGFVSGRWNRANASPLSEWGLGGRRFGTIITWFMLGGDVYTAYTFVAVPALVFGAGAMGFFSVLTMMLVYPILFAIFPKLWSVSHARGYMTAADFVRARFDNHILALAIAVTGIVATMPYIALQLVGLEVVIAGLGVHFAIVVGGVSLELPLLIAFVVLAAYTYTGGLRASAMISIVKNVLVYGTVIAAVVVIPAELGGYGHIFAGVAVSKQLLLLRSVGTSGHRRPMRAWPWVRPWLIPLPTQHYGHFELIKSGRHQAQCSNNARIYPRTWLHCAAWFYGDGSSCRDDAGLCQSIPGIWDQLRCSSAFFRNVSGLVRWYCIRRNRHRGPSAGGYYVDSERQFVYAQHLQGIFRFKMHASRECQVAKFAALVVMMGGLIFNLGFPRVYAVQMQLLGGIWIIQTLPAVILGLYTSRLHPWALLIGWVGGISAGTAMAASTGLQNSVYDIHIFGIVMPCYIAVSTLILNVVLSVVCSPIFNAIARHPGADADSDRRLYLRNRGSVRRLALALLRT